MPNICLALGVCLFFSLSLFRAGMGVKETCFVGFTGWAGGSMDVVVDVDVDVVVDDVGTWSGRMNLLFRHLTLPLDVST